MFCGRLPGKRPRLRQVPAAICPALGGRLPDPERPERLAGRLAQQAGRGNRRVGGPPHLAVLALEGLPGKGEQDELAAGAARDARACATAIPAAVNAWNGRQLYHQAGFEKAFTVGGPVPGAAAAIADATALRTATPAVLPDRNRAGNVRHRALPHALRTGSLHRPDFSAPT